MTLSGTVPQDMINTLFDFDSALRKKKFNDQFVFDQTKGDHVSPRMGPNGGTWNMSLELSHAEAEPR